MSWITAIISALFGGLWDKWFPPKTASDQRADDAEKALQDSKNANQIQQDVKGKSDADLDSDLSKWVRRD